MSENSYSLRESRQPKLKLFGRGLRARQCATGRRVVRSFVRSSVRSLVRSFFRSFARSVLPSFVRLFGRSFVRSRDLPRAPQERPKTPQGPPKTGRKAVVGKVGRGGPGDGIEGRRPFPPCPGGSWGVLEGSWEGLGRLGSVRIFLGGGGRPFWAHFGPSWAVLGPPPCVPSRARTGWYAWWGGPTMRTIALRPVLGGPWDVLGRSWGVPGTGLKAADPPPPCVPLLCCCLGTVLGPYWCRLGAFLGPSWAVLGPSWGHLGPSWGLPEGARGLRDGVRGKSRRGL